MSQDDHIDEVALNVLLSEGVDFPTALEASRIPADPDTAREPAAGSRSRATLALEAVGFAVVAIVMMMLVWVLL